MVTRFPRTLVCSLTSGADKSCFLRFRYALLLTLDKGPLALKMGLLVRIGGNFRFCQRPGSGLGVLIELLVALGGAE